MLEALRSIFEFVGKNYYNSKLSVELVDEADTAYAMGNRICLPVPLLEKFTQDKLPRFTVFYHELGHTLYSHSLSDFIDRWQHLPNVASNYAYNDNYHHLLNWIEDFYIEQQLEKDYPYLHDILGCLKRLTFTYNIDDVDKAFNHYYVKGYASPGLNAVDGFQFSNYLKTLIGYRADPMFKTTPISLLSNKSLGAKFIKTFIEFYNWCVQKGILQDVPMPALSNPNNILVPGANGQPGPNGQQQMQGDNGGAGTSSPHTHLVGGYKEVFPDIDVSNTAIFVDQFTSEQKMIREEIANRVQVQSTNTSLDGLFTALLKDTAIIQNKVIVKNFFNPNRLVDGVLFRTPEKAFNNVSIYRDISGSTHYSYFRIINNICKYLIDKIPIATHFYLYASGDISILETQFQDWDDHHEVPDLYAVDPVYQQMDGGTNSGAVADVITEQLSDKWLNIIITDGDLDDLFKRDNIDALLKNIFIINVGSCRQSDRIDPTHMITIKDESEIPTIANAMLNMKGA